MAGILQNANRERKLLPGEIIFNTHPRIRQRRSPGPKIAIGL
jgi:hypothetical protein